MSALYEKLRFVGCTIFWKSLDGQWYRFEFPTNNCMQKWWSHQRMTAKCRKNGLRSVDFPTWQQLAFSLDSNNIMILNHERHIVWPEELIGYIEMPLNLTYSDIQILLNQ